MRTPFAQTQKLLAVDNIHGARACCIVANLPPGLISDHAMLAEYLLLAPAISHVKAGDDGDAQDAHQIIILR